MLLLCLSGHVPLVMRFKKVGCSPIVGCELQKNSIREFIVMIDYSGILLSRINKYIFKHYYLKFYFLVQVFFGIQNTNIN